MPRPHTTPTTEPSLRPETLSELRSALATEQARAEEQLRSLTGELRVANDELSNVDQHPGDHGTNVAERETRVSLIEALESRIDEVRAAIERIDDGSYGRDERTGEPIDLRRLRAIPWARTNIVARRPARPRREAP